MVRHQALPSLASIRAFEAAARLGGFARAANELQMTAAAVSYHVRQLERQTGVALFDRRAQAVALTEAGAEIAAEATRFFDALRATFVRASNMHADRFAITTLPSLGASWLTPRLGRFRDLHSGIAIELDLSADPQPLGTGSFDVAIRHGEGRWPGLRTTKLFPVLFMPLCSPSLLDRIGKLTSPDSLSRVPLLGRTDWWEQWCTAAGWPGVRIANRIGTRFAAEHLDATAAIAGHGVTIGNPLLFVDDLAAGRLVPAHDTIAADGCHFWLAYPIARTARELPRQFADWVSEEARSTLRQVARLLSKSDLPN